jgi:hypothetical protein
VGLRFQGIDVPRGATVLGARIQFASDETASVPTSLIFEGEASDDAASFAKVQGDVSSRPRTDAAVGWEPAPWMSGAAGPDQRRSGGSRPTHAGARGDRAGDRRPARMDAGQLDGLRDLGLRPSDGPRLPRCARACSSPRSRVRGRSPLVSRVRSSTAFGPRFGPLAALRSLALALLCLTRAPCQRPESGPSVLRRTSDSGH